MAVANASIEANGGAKAEFRKVGVSFLPQNGDSLPIHLVP
jgi:hypothetical protein